MDEWIRVEDRLPEVDERVLVMCDGDVAVGFLPIRMVAWVILTGVPRDSIVTHWMPMPDPPKKEEPFKTKRHGIGKYAVVHRCYGIVARFPTRESTDNVCRALNEIWRVDNS